MKFIVNAVLVSTSCFLMMGCAIVMGDLPAISAGLTGCPPNVIAIKDESLGYFNDTWTAQCQGVTFYCMRPVRGSTTCTEALLNTK